MRKTSPKTKIFLLSAIFLLITAMMFLYGYGIWGGRNQSLASGLSQRRLELEILQREQRNVEQGKKDLATLESASHPPDELFSRDTKVVKEIQLLESAAKLYSLNLTLGVSGTAATAVKVQGATGEVYAIPYTMTVSGSFDNALLFIQAIEHMPFIINSRSVKISVDPQTLSQTTFTSAFYIQK